MPVPSFECSSDKGLVIGRFPDFDVGDSTTRLYVNQIREEYQIPKTRKIRHYESVEEQPMGKQMQVDWGETKRKTERRKKLSSFVFVLSYRIHIINILNGKIVRLRRGIQSEVMKMPLREYYGGMPEEIVYDQDHLITVSENAGDIILMNFKHIKSSEVSECIFVENPIRSRKVK